VTLLVDPALLYASGYGLGRFSRDDTASAKTGALVAGSVLGLSVATYCDLPRTRAISKALGARSGRDLILNSWGVLKLDPEVRSPRRAAIVRAVFASYPVWMAAGLAAGRRGRARQS
jgi:hypothetical protein